MSNLDQFVVSPSINLVKVLVTCDCCDKPHHIQVTEDNLEDVLSFPVHTCTTCDAAMSAIWASQADAGIAALSLRDGE